MSSPLHGVQQDLGARFEPVGGRETVLHFGDPIAEYNAVVSGLGLIDRSDAGKLVLTGSDRASWLQGMISNDVRRLERGAQVVCGCVLNATGHLLADVRVLVRGDGLLLDMARENVEKIYRILDGFIIAEDVEIVDQSDFLACLSLQGPGAVEQHARSAIERLEGATTVPADHTGCGGSDLYLRAADAPDLYRELVERGAQPVGYSAAETLRIEAGIPRYGVDMDEGTIPLECNLEQSHIDYDKGCYVGQEIIARIRSRGHTNRRLTGLVLEGAELPRHGHRIYPAAGDTSTAVGWVTSSTHSPLLGRVIALSYLRHEHSAPGTSLRVVEGDALIPAIASDLPFSRAG